MSGQRVTITGASGYIALHCIVEALRRGYRVRGTLRSTKRQAEIEAAVASHVDPGDRLELISGIDLLDDAGWDDAMQGSHYLLHVASPVPVQTPAHESELIEPALNGTRRALRAASKAGIDRMVMTSSIAAVSAGHAYDPERVYDEGDWSRLDSPEVSSYQKSKTLAEKEAWKLSEELGLDLVTINPGYVLGPCVIADPSPSLQIVRKLLDRAVPGVPDLRFALVDVRDVARMHLEALERSDAGGKRFILAGEPVPYVEIARALAAHVGPHRKIPTRPVPKLVVRLVGLFDKTARMVIDDIGKSKRYSTVRARELLGWQPTPLAAMVGDSADSLIAHGLVP